MRTLLILTLIISFSFKVNASALSKGIYGGAIYFTITKILPRATPFVLKGLSEKLKKYIIKNPGAITGLTAFLASIAYENSNLRDKTYLLLTNSGLMTNDEVIQLAVSTKEYDKAHDYVLENIATYNNKSSNCNRLDVDKLTSRDYSSFSNYAGNPVRLYDTGSFGNLKSREIIGDKMEHDHIPSLAAIKKHILRISGKKRLSKQENDLLKDNTSTIEVDKQTHKDGRTWFYKNNAAQTTLDSKSLRIATLKDFAYHVMNTKYDRKLIEGLKRVYIRNSALCLYKK